jgi:hypothetical protein
MGYKNCSLSVVILLLAKCYRDHGDAGGERIRAWDRALGAARCVKPRPVGPSGGSGCLDDVLAHACKLGLEGIVSLGIAGLSQASPYYALEAPARLGLSFPRTWKGPLSAASCE